MSADQRLWRPSKRIGARRAREDGPCTRDARAQSCTRAQRAQAKCTARCWPQAHGVGPSAGTAVARRGARGSGAPEASCAYGRRREARESGRPGLPAAVEGAVAHPAWQFWPTPIQLAVPAHHRMYNRLHVTASQLLPGNACQQSRIGCSATPALLSPQGIRQMPAASISCSWTPAAAQAGFLCGCRNGIGAAACAPQRGLRRVPCAGGVGRRGKQVRRGATLQLTALALGCASIASAAHPTAAVPTGKARRASVKTKARSAAAPPVCHGLRNDSRLRRRARQARAAAASVGEPPPAQACGGSATRAAPRARRTVLRRRPRPPRSAAAAALHAASCATALQRRCATAARLHVRGTPVTLWPF